MSEPMTDEAGLRMMERTEEARGCHHLAKALKAGADALSKLSSPDYVVVKREDAEAIVKTLDACYQKEARALLGLSDSEGT